MSDVLVVGSLNSDFIVAVERRPDPGETVAGADLVTAPGGKGANAAVAIARLGGNVTLLGRVGADARGDALREALREAGVDDRFIRAIRDAVSGSAIVVVTPDGENAIVVSPGANARVHRADVDETFEASTEVRCVLAQLELPLDVVAYALERARHAGARAILNAAPARQLSGDVLALADPLVVNEHEAAFLLGGPFDDGGAQQAAHGLLARGARSAVITLGAGGAVAAQADGRSYRVTAPAVPVVDTTGAGDAFAGALALELARGATLERAVAFGVRAGSLAVQRLGAQASLPTRAQVERGAVMPPSAR